MIPTNEQETIIKFVREMPEDWEIVGFRTRGFPDATLKISRYLYEVEFEFQASNFLHHQHDVVGCDFVVCWEDDLGNASPIPVISIQKPDWGSHPLLSDASTLRAVLELEKRKRHLLKRYVKETQIENRLLRKQHIRVRGILREIANYIEIGVDMPWEDLDAIAIAIQQAFGGEDKIKARKGPGRPVLPLDNKILSEALIAWITRPPGKTRPAYSMFSTDMKTSFPRGKEHLKIAEYVYKYLLEKGISFQ